MEFLTNISRADVLGRRTDPWMERIFQGLQTGVYTTKAPEPTDAFSTEELSALGLVSLWKTGKADTNEQEAS